MEAREIGKNDSLASNQQPNSIALPSHQATTTTIMTQLDTPHLPDLDTRLAFAEYYRPKDIQDIVGQDDILQQILQYFCDKKPTHRLPHFLFVGPPGVGKTSVAKCLFEENPYIHAVTYNASSSRGPSLAADVVQWSERPLASSTTTHRVLVLEEAEQIMPRALDIIASCMRRAPGWFRVCMLCNFRDKMEMDGFSTFDFCHLVHFHNINQTSVERVFNKICDTQRISCSKGGRRLLMENCHGDLRVLSNLLQKACLFAPLDKSNMFQKQPIVLSDQNIVDILDLPDAQRVQTWMDFCRRAHAENRHMRVMLQESTSMLAAMQHPIQDILHQVYAIWMQDFAAAQTALPPNNTNKDGFTMATIDFLIRAEELDGLFTLTNTQSRGFEIEAAALFFFYLSCLPK